MFSKIFRGNSQYPILIPDNGAKNLIDYKCTGVVVI